MKKLFMKPLAAIALITVLTGSLVACTSVANSSNTNIDNGHNAQNSLDYDGIYDNKTTLFLNSNFLANFLNARSRKR